MLADTMRVPAAKRGLGDTISLAAGTYALVATAAVAVIDLWWGLTHEDYSYVSDTISDLAAGTNSTVMDVALKTFAVAVGVVGLALLRWNPGGRAGRGARFTVGALIVCALAPVVYFIAAYDGYSGEPTGDMTVHLYLVYALGIGFPVAAWLTGPGFRTVSGTWRDWSLAIAALWVLAAPWFMVMGTSWDGLYERGLALMLLAWFAAAAWNLVRCGRGLV